jgi:hypothetical protein
LRLGQKAAVILPFEEALLRQHGVDATFVGHPAARPPLGNAGAGRRACALGLRAEDPVLAVFPGSRRSEIGRHMGPFMETARELVRRHPRLQVIVSAAPGIGIDASRVPVSRGARRVVHRAARGDGRLAQERHDDARGGGGRTAARDCVSHECDQLRHRAPRGEDPAHRAGERGGRARVSREFVQDAVQPVAVADAEHRDGEIIARLVESWGYRTVRGSTSRGAGRALLGMVRDLAAGKEFAITPDGPRGPAGAAQPGVLMASQRARAPIVPMRSEVSATWHMKSWDRFMIPKPFARIRVIYGDPWVATSADDDAQEELARRMGPALPPGVAPGRAKGGAKP